MCSLSVQLYSDRFGILHLQIDEERKIQQTIVEVEQKISKYQEQEKVAKQRREDDDDDLDDFMSHLSNEKAIDKTEIKKLRVSNLPLKITFKSTENNEFTFLDFSSNCNDSKMIWLKPRN